MAMPRRGVGEWGLTLIGAISSLPASNFIIVDRKGTIELYIRFYECM